MPNNEGTPLHGDRAAYNVNDFPGEHADGLPDHPQYHVPLPGVVHNVVISNGTDWTSRALEDADIPDAIARDAEVTAAIAAHTAVADAHHDPVTLDANADTLLSLTTQALGLDTQVAHAALIGPQAGADAAPTFRALVEADISDLDHTDADAIHDNVAAEISAVAEKATPADADLLLIEDSAAGNAKKRVQIGNLPGGSGSAIGEIQLLYSLVVNTAVTNTTDETALLGAGRGTKTLPADTLDLGSVLRLTLHGYLSDTGTPTLNIKAKAGGTEICSTGAVTLASNISSLGWSLDVAITCRATGAAGTVVAAGIFEYDDNAGHRMVKTGTTVVDTTASLDIAVTATWGTAAAGNTITCQVATIELLKADDLAVAAPSGLTVTEV